MRSNGVIESPFRACFVQYGIPLLVYQDGFVIVERNQFQRIPVALQGLAGTRFEGIFPDMRENGVVKYIEGRVIREIGRKGFVVHNLIVFSAKLFCLVL